MTGGNQVKLATLVVGTPLGKAILAAHQRGALIAGTSAGASILSTHMVSFGSGGATPKFRVGQVSQGLGLLDRRDRRSALHPAQPVRPAAGAGRREPGAAGHRHRRGHRGDHPAGRPLEVKGRGVVTVVRRADVLTTAYTATGTQPLMMSGIQLHTLPARGGLRPVRPPAGVRARPARHQPGPLVPTLADVPAGTRPRTRRIAAEGAHETTSELRRRPASS